MAPATSAHSHPGGHAVTSVTPVNIFALLFEILIFILVVLSIVAAVRRYFGARIGHQAPAQAPLVVDLEVQADQGDISAKHSSHPLWLSSLRGQILSSSRDDYLSDTTALLEKDISKSGLPLPVSSARSSSSGVSSLQKLFGRFRSLPLTGVKVSLISILLRERRSSHTTVCRPTRLDGLSGSGPLAPADPPGPAYSGMGPHHSRRRWFTSPLPLRNSKAEACKH